MTAPLDIIVVNYNTREDVLACLESVLRSPDTRVARTFVVDNKSTDGSASAIREAWPTVELIEMDRNAGFAAANNVALRKATAPLVLLLNSDTVVPIGALDQLANRLEASGAVAAGPRLVDSTGRPEVSFGSMLSPIAEARQWRLQRFARLDTPDARSRIAALLAAERDVDWVSGACLLVRRDAALAAGLFDERYFLYEEDVDFCAALRAQGGRVIFTPTVEVLHRRGGSAHAPGATSRHHYDRSHIAFYEKHRPRWAPWLKAWLRLRGRNLR